MVRVACPKCAAQVVAQPGTLARCPRCGFEAEVPVPAQGYGAAYAPQPGAYGYPPQYAPPAAYRQTSGLAVASMCVGIAGVCPFYILGVLLGPVAIILGAVGLRQIRREPQKWTGAGMAIAGIVTGSVAAAIGLVAGLGFFLSMWTAMSCADNPSLC